MSRILIVDDHAIVRRGLRQIVSEAADMRVVAEAADGQEALDRVRQGGVDLVLLDISMPGRGGMDTLRRLKREQPGLPVLILSIYPEDQYKDLPLLLQENPPASYNRLKTALYTSFRDLNAMMALQWRKRR